MKKAVIFIVFVLLAVSAALASGSGPASRVKVTVALANVRTRPSSDASVILTAESGRIFDVIEKAGEWFCVALPDGKKGYLSATIVVEIDESGKPIPPPVAVPAPAAPSAQRPADRSAPPASEPGAEAALPKMELGLFGGYASTFKMGPANYYAEWYADLLTDILESTDISVAAKGAAFFGASFTYYFTPNFGLQVSGGHLSPAIATTSDLTYGWTWDTAAGGGTYSQTASWTGASKLSTTVFSLDAVQRFAEGRLVYSLLAGVTLFRCSFQASGTVGYGVTWEWQEGDTLYQNLDALPVPAEIPLTTWTGVGFNLGFGLTYQLSSHLGLSLEARYFDGGLKNLNWTFTPGAYDGLFTGAVKQWAVSSGDTDFIASYTTPLPVNPSFFQITAGIKIGL